MQRSLIVPVVFALALCLPATGCGRKTKEAVTPTAPLTPSASGSIGAGPNLLENGDFQKAADADATLPAGWRRLQSTAKTVRLVERSGGREGDLALEIRPHPEGKMWQVLGQELPLPISPTTYAVSFDGRIEGTGKAKVTLYLRKGRGKYERLGVRAFSGAEWRRYSFAAEVLAQGGEALEIWVSQADYRDLGCVAQFDNIAVQKAK